jgi:hypothetical protein
MRTRARVRGKEGARVREEGEVRVGEEEKVRVRKELDRCYKKDDAYLSVSPPKPRHPHKTDLFRMIKLGKASNSEKSSEVRGGTARLVVRGRGIRVVPREKDDCVITITSLRVCGPGSQSKCTSGGGRNDPAKLPAYIRPQNEKSVLRTGHTDSAE